MKIVYWEEDMGKKKSPQTFSVRDEVRLAPRISHSLQKKQLGGMNSPSTN